MVKNPINKSAYAEPFDMERLEEIADRAKQNKGTNGSFSDLECHVYSLMESLIRFGSETRITE